MITKLNVLLVDDDPVCHFINTKVLQRLGLTRINTVSNGREALNLIGESISKNLSIPDVIFVDLDMPVLNGFGFIEAFGKLNIPQEGKTRIAILTSSSDHGDMKHATKLGIVHYLTKPALENSVRPVLDAVVSQKFERQSVYSGIRNEEFLSSSSLVEIR